jgi:uncharacterized protein YjiS (DUF1127 family)
MAQSFAGPLAGFLPGSLSTPHHQAPAKRGGVLLALLRTWRRRSEEKAQLARFDAREMQDVGLTEADRVGILNTPLWREAAPRR